MRKGMVCEPAHFPVLNSFGVLGKEFNCSSTQTINEQYLDFLPAWSKDGSEELGVEPGACLVNGNSQLLSCAGMCVFEFVCVYVCSILSRLLTLGGKLL